VALGEKQALYLRTYPTLPRDKQGGEEEGEYGLAHDRIDGAGRRHGQGQARNQHERAGQRQDREHGIRRRGADQAVDVEKVEADDRDEAAHRQERDSNGGDLLRSPREVGAEQIHSHDRYQADVRTIEHPLDLATADRVGTHECPCDQRVEREPEGRVHEVDGRNHHGGCNGYTEKPARYHRSDEGEQPQPGGQSRPGVASRLGKDDGDAQRQRVREDHRDAERRQPGVGLRPRSAGERGPVKGVRHAGEEDRGRQGERQASTEK
jgi:hypothetical protein